MNTEAWHVKCSNIYLSQAYMIKCRHQWNLFSLRVTCLRFTPTVVYQHWLLFKIKQHTFGIVVFKPVLAKYYACQPNRAAFSEEVNLVVHEQSLALDMIFTICFNSM